jgi:hypothetical protein
MIDPPSGWLYGFPKPIPNGYVKSDTLLRIWLIGNGYPKEFMESAMKYSRYWEKDIE